MLNVIYKSFVPYFIVALFLISCGSSSTSNKDRLRGNISVSGAFALYPLTVVWAEEFQKLHPRVRVDISAGGAGKGLMDALSGMVDLGMFSREITEEEISKGTWYIAVAKDAVLPTINENNPYLSKILKTGISSAKFEQIFINEQITNWGQLVDTAGTDKINIYTRSDACGAAEMWGKFLKKNQESLQGVGVFGDPGMADAVKNDKFGLGYNNVIYIYDMKSRVAYPGLKVIPIDINNNNVIDPSENYYESLDSIMSAIRINKFPSPPARNLYFVAKGKPKHKAIKEMLYWILTDGQNFVEESGYVKLPEELRLQELAKLNYKKPVSNIFK